MQENTAKTAAEWVFVAKSVAEMPGGESQALRCMARAAVLAQSVEDWISIAKAWARDFGDAEMARQCQEKAESHADDSEEWERIADFFADFGLYEMEVNCRRMAAALGSQDAIFTPKTVSLAEASDKSTSGWISDVQKSIGNSDIALAITFIAKAEAMAKSAFDWTEIARTWIRYLHDRNNACRCLTEAESAAKKVYEWVGIARDWARTFHDKHSARRCMALAESAVESLFDWGSLAEGWNTIFLDKNNAFRCMLEAEKTPPEWGEYWDWIAIAEGWRDVFHDWNSVIQSMEKAESRAFFRFDLEQVADAWHKFGYSERAESIREKVRSRTF